MTKPAPFTTPQAPVNSGLQPCFKPLRIKMSPAFRKAFAKHNILSLVNALRRIFLRLGFDGYAAENEVQGCRIRLQGHNLKTGRYCDHHTVFRGSFKLAEAFNATISDEKEHYQLELSLSREHPGTEPEGT